MNHAGVTSGAGIVPGLALLVLLSGCAGPRDEARRPKPGPTVTLTGSRIPVSGTNAVDAARAGAAPTSVYTRDDLERSGSPDLPRFLERVPSVRVHR